MFIQRVIVKRISSKQYYVTYASSIDCLASVNVISSIVTGLFARTGEIMNTELHIVNPPS